MHVNTVGASIDLRSAKLDEMKEFGFDAAIVEIAFDCIHGTQGFLRKFGVVQAWLEFFRHYRSSHSFISMPEIVRSRGEKSGAFSVSRGPGAALLRSSDRVHRASA